MKVRKKERGLQSKIKCVIGIILPFFTENLFHILTISCCILYVIILCLKICNSEPSPFWFGQTCAWPTKQKLCIKKKVLCFYSIRDIKIYGQNVPHSFQLTHLWHKGFIPYQSSCFCAWNYHLEFSWSVYMWQRCIVVKNVCGLMKK